ncbi:DUF6896 domain-containing protein [Streptomyces sp. NPDC019443]|uniref:DUF6896 domain-containing protein n=1 Tax=Streptomyces sp. NPDC019443 TaxID=3365061 RepID=UPI00379E00BB
MTVVNGSAREYVLEFVSALASVKQSMVASYPELRTLSDVIPLVRRGDMDRRGASREGVSYAIHGFGCRMVDREGREVDVDFLPDGSEVFDDWRVIRFAESLDDGIAISRENVLSSCRELVRDGILEEVRAGWFGPAGLKE